MAASADPAKVSPKVRAVGWSTLGLSVLLAVVTALTTWASGLTPDQLPMLGIWALPAITLVTGVINTVAGYLKADPLRQDNALKLNTPLTVVDGVPVYVKPAGPEVLPADQVVRSEGKFTDTEQAESDKRFEGNAG